MPIGDRNTVNEERRLTILGHAVLEGKEATKAILSHQVEFCWCNPLSPLNYKASEAEDMIRVARSGKGWNSISPEVMLGGSGPVTMAGALVQHNAEVLAGVMLSRRVPTHALRLALGGLILAACARMALDLFA